MSPKQRADKKWLENAEHWGEWIRYSETELVDGPPESIWMMKSTSGPQVRFYAIGKGQVGSEHPHVVAATAWAWGNRWLMADEDIRGQLACRAYVLAGGAAADGHAVSVPA